MRRKGSPRRRSCKITERLTRAGGLKLSGAEEERGDGRRR